MFKQLSREPFLIWADGESNRSYVRHPYIEVLSRWRWPPTFQPNSYFSRMELFITQSVPKTNSPNSSNSYTISQVPFPWNGRRNQIFQNSCAFVSSSRSLSPSPRRRYIFKKKKRYINFPTLAISMWHRSTREKFTGNICNRTAYLERSRLSFKAERVSLVVSLS